MHIVRIVMVGEAETVAGFQPAMTGAAAPLAGVQDEHELPFVSG
jgi:hypothetical protein